MGVRWRPLLFAGLAAGGAIGGVLVAENISHPAHVVKPPTFTVARLNARAVHNVIAAGTVGGKMWRIRLTKAHARDCWSRPGSGMAANSDCLETVGDALKHMKSYTQPVNIWTFSPALFGPVQPDVARVSMRLSDGAVLNLYPVEAYGHRWIGLVLPEGLWPVKAVAFSRNTEIVHSVPFVGEFAGDRKVGFLTWLPPGDDGPRRMTKLIRGGGESLVLHTGPWGNCLVGSGMLRMFPLDYVARGALEGGGGLPRTVPMAFPWPARYVRLEMSDDTVRRVSIVPGAGVGFAIIRAPRKPRILSWSVYDAGGHRLSGGIGVPGSQVSLVRYPRGRNSGRSETA